MTALVWGVQMGTYDKKGGGMAETRRSKGKIERLSGLTRGRRRLPARR
jgi:hypothetical protein